MSYFRDCDIKQELDETLKQVASVSKVKYDGQYIRKGNRTVKVQMLKNPDYATNLNKKNGTLYVAPSDTKYYSKLKMMVERI